MSSTLNTIQENTSCLQNNLKFFNDKKNYKLSPQLIAFSKKKLSKALINKIIAACFIYFYRINSYQPINILFFPTPLRGKTNASDTLSKALPLSIALTPDTTLIAALQKVKENITYAMQHHFVENIKSISNTITSNDILLEISKKPNKKINTNNQIYIHVNEENDNLSVNVNHRYSSCLRDSITENIKNLLKIISSKKKLAIKNIELVSKTEKKLLLQTWNNTSVRHNLNQTITSCFQKQVINHPQKIAITCEGKAFTYKYLDEISSRLAAHICSLGASSERKVAIILNRSFEALVSILAILKAGGTYVPIDIGYPKERVNYILADATCSLIITTNKHLSEKFSFLNKKNNISILKIDDNFNGIAQHLQLSGKVNNAPNKSAYIIYTSGSTGNPKGVITTHKNVLNYAYWFATKFKLTHTSIVDFSSSLGFDISISCTLVPLIFGARVAICSEDNKLDPFLYLNHLQEQKVSHVELTPDYYHHLLAYPLLIKRLKFLKWIMLGGDAIIKKDIEHWFAISNRQKIVNEYGPTECTVAITAHIVEKNNLHKYPNSIPIGKPACNTRAYVLDPYLNLCPIGIPGELFISGDSVAKGYLNSTSNNKKAFLKNPYAKDKHTRLYKTGDLVRWLSDGNLEFLGRNDEQVKIRGYRVELSEIENRLLQYKQIKQCKISPYKEEDGTTILIAFIVYKNLEQSLNEQKIRNFLKLYLPDFMIPTKFFFLEKFPTNHTEKVDVKKLIELARNTNFDKDTNIFEQNDTLSKLHAIWCEVLNKKSIPPNASFFDIGGYSLAALKIFYKIENIFLLKLPVGIIFKYPTLKQLAKVIDNLKGKFNTEILSILSNQPQLIHLRASTKNKPLFLIPPVGGTIFIYRKMVELLSADCPVFGLQDPGIHKPDIRFANLQQIASCYLESIKKIQSNGPYFLAGASFGATLAVEIANQLELIGEKVQFLGLFDGWAHYNQALKDKSFFTQTMKKSLIGYDEEKAKELLNMQHSRELLLFDYAFPQLHTKITLFKAQSVWSIFNDSKCNGWDDYYKNVNVHLIPGDHETMFEYPGVNALSKIISSILNKQYRTGIKYHGLSSIVAE